jgi:hypothetical protein
MQMVKSGCRQRLHEDVSDIILGGDIQDMYIAIFMAFTDIVPLHVNVLGVSMEVGVLGKGESGFIVCQEWGRVLLGVANFSGKHP